MASYELRQMPPAVWEAFQARAKRDGWQTRELIIELLREFAAGHIHLSAQPSGASGGGWIRGPMPTSAGDAVIVQNLNGNSGRFWVWTASWNGQQEPIKADNPIAVEERHQAELVAARRLQGSGRVFLQDFEANSWQELRRRPGIDESTGSSGARSGRQSG